MRRFSLIALLLGASCGAGVTAVEPTEGSVLRVIATFADGEMEISSLVGDAAFKKNIERLRSDSRTMEVWVFGYSMATLAGTYPGLDGVLPEDLKLRVVPRLGTTPEGHVPPDADVVLTTTIDDGSGTSIEYDTKTWGEWEAASLDSARAPFVFDLPQSIGCPDRDRTFRLFALDDPAGACPGQRSPACGLRIESACTSRLAAICPNATPTSVVELPSGQLQIGEATCSAIDRPSDRAGISKVWQCAAGVCGDGEVTIAVQDMQMTKLGSDDVPWVPTVGLHQVNLSNDLPFGGEYYATARGALYGAPGSNNTRFLRLEMDLLGSPPEETATDDRLVTVDPANMQNTRPIVLRNDELGALRRMSVDDMNSYLVIQGSKRTYLLLEDEQPRDEFGFLPAVELIHGRLFTGTRRRVGELVSGRLFGRTRVYAAVADGLANIEGADVSRIAAATANGTGPSLSTTVPHRVTVVLDGGVERVVICEREGIDLDPEQRPPMTAMCSTNTVHVYADNTNHDFDATVPGEILAIADGLRVVYRSPTNAFELGICELRAGGCDAPTGPTGRRYLVPPSDSRGGALIEVQRDGLITIQGKEMLAYSYGKYVGMLDLATGFSTAAAPTRATGGSHKRIATVAFESILGTKAWVVGQDEDGLQALDRIGFIPLR